MKWNIVMWFHKFTIFQKNWFNFQKLVNYLMHGCGAIHITITVYTIYRERILQNWIYQHQVYITMWLHLIWEYYKIENFIEQHNVKPRNMCIHFAILLNELGDAKILYGKDCL